MIKPIPTSYAGCRFRSRLEARWAVFLDHLRIRWEYEAQGYELPSGRYLPDFWLPEINSGVFFEIKPDLGAPHEDDPRWSDLVQASKRDLYVAFGMPRTDNPETAFGAFMEVWSYQAPTPEFSDDPGWDNYQAFAACDVCGTIGITFEGRQRMRCHPRPDDSNRSYAWPQFVDAYTAARSARFEHGQHGA